MRPTKLLVFDLETVPDVELARKLNKEWADLEDVAVRAKLAGQMVDRSRERNGGGSDFAPACYHKIVAIGCLMAEIEHVGGGREAYHYKKFGCIGADDECELLEKLLEFGGRERTLLVSFNGIRFDLPTVRLRALKHGLTCKWLFQQSDKWKNYFKNSVEHHDDLADLLGGPLKMNEAAKLAGLPGKLDTDGSWVADLMADGQLQAVRNYCETDILNTYLLYLRYQHIIGVLDEVALRNEEQRLREELHREREARPHLGEFVDAWPDAWTARDQRRQNARPTTDAA